MKSLCVDARLISAPGIGTYLKNMLAHLKGAPWKWFALIHRENAQKLALWDHIQPIFISSSIYSFKEQIELPLKIPNVDLFWSPHYNVPCLLIRARKRLASIHDVFHLAFASKLGFMEKIYAKGMMQAAMRLSDGIITCSDFSKREIQTYTGITHRSLNVIPYGVDKGLFYPLDDISLTDSVMEKYGIKKPFLLYVGSFKSHKNLHGLMKAFSLLVEKGFSDKCLVIVGGGKGMRHCEDVKQLYIAYPALREKVHFVGYVPDEDLPHFYRSAQLFVFPSFYEGFGFPPLEAMSVGCPVVVSQAGALPEVCREGAVYVDPHFPDQIANQLIALLQNDIKRKELSIRGLERSKVFCWKKCAQKHYDLIERLILDETSRGV